jgi:hypothetical protein
MSVKTLNSWKSALGRSCGIAQTPLRRGKMNHKSRTFLILTAVLALGALFGSSAAQAATTGTSCGYTNFEQPFQSWGDFNTYVLAPGGSFESGSAPNWTLSGGATVSSPGNGVFSSSSAYSLYVPAGGVAVSAPICVETGFPYSRIFSKTITQNSKYKTALKVETLYVDTTGKSISKQVGVITQTGFWNLTGKLSLPSTTSIKPDAYGRLWVRYRFTPLYSTAWRIDDLYVDPKKH